MTDKEKEKAKEKKPDEPAWQDEDVDEAERESFPASDPPAYTTGIERRPSQRERVSGR